MITAERAAAEIRRAYGTHTTQYGAGAHMSIRTLADRCDLPHPQITAGVRHLLNTDDRFLAIPESNQRTLTAEDWDLAIWIGGQWTHLICWD